MKSIRLTVLLFCSLILNSLCLAVETSKPKPPQRLRSLGHLSRMLKNHKPQYFYNGPFFNTVNMPTFTEFAGDAGLATTALPMGAPAGTGSSFSSTNVQVDGVDEGDIVKTDGEYIYQVSRSRVLVVQAVPETALSVKSILNFDSYFYPMEVYLAGDKLIVIGSANRTEVFEKNAPLYQSYAPTVKALVFDTADKSALKQVREVEIEGNYISSRRIDSSVYLIARKYPEFYVYPQIEALAGADIGTGVVVPSTTGTPRKRSRNAGMVPGVKDTARGGRFQKLSFRDMFYFPGFSEPDYLIVAGFDLAQPETKADVKAYLGAGNEVYALRENLYVAASKIPFTVEPLRPEFEQPTEFTSVFRFALKSGQISFSAQGDVPGTILNQFSMDESGDYFRIATTRNNFTFDGTSSNNVYVLDKTMQITGKLEGIAPGERIYSTRFIGDRCYMVTFRQIDPFFVISLKDPAAPVILGELKIPGFSEYLHPYDDNHVLGFGRNTVDGFATGMKVSLFDVTDVSNPLEQYSVIIGDQGTYSEVLYSHKSLLFDREKNLLAFPVVVADNEKIQPVDPGDPTFFYNPYTFNGAYVYELTLQNGFVLRKQITHVDPANVNNWYYDGNIRRILYIGANLYTVSDSKIKVNDLTTLEDKTSLDLPVTDVPNKL
jgi:inhibitor of cysteine peptidase